MCRACKVSSNYGDAWSVMLIELSLTDSGQFSVLEAPFTLYPAHVPWFMFICTVLTVVLKLLTVFSTITCSADCCLGAVFPDFVNFTFV